MKVKQITTYFKISQAFHLGNINIGCILGYKTYDLDQWTIIDHMHNVQQHIRDRDFTASDFNLTLILFNCMCM